MAVRSYRELIAWQKAMDFAEMVYKLTAGFPKEEIYGLRSQIIEQGEEVGRLINGLANSLSPK